MLAVAMAIFTIETVDQTRDDLNYLLATEVKTEVAVDQRIIDSVFVCFHL